MTGDPQAGAPAPAGTADAVVSGDPAFAGGAPPVTGEPHEVTATEATGAPNPPMTRPGPIDQEEDEEAAFGVLANRNFLVLWLSQLATQVGGNTVLYGLTVLIYDQTRSNSTVSLLLLSFLAPAVIFGAIAGVFVDRFDRRNVLIVTSLVRGLMFLAIAFFNANVVVILVLNVVVSIATTFFAPAELAVIPLLVRRSQLIAATGLFTLTLNAAFAVGFTLLGPLLTKVASPTVLLMIVAALYVVSSVLCWTLPAAPPGVVQADASAARRVSLRASLFSVLDQLREGFAFIRSDSNAAWALTYLATAASIVGVLGVLGPDFAVKLLRLAPDDFVVVVLPLGFGVVFGALLVNAIRNVIPRRRQIEAGLIVVGICLALITVAGPISTLLLTLTSAQPVFDASAVISVVTVVIFLATVAGTGYAMVAIPAQTELQEDIPEEVRGRVFGVLNTLVSVASFLPIIIVGPISDVVGIAPVVLVCALLVIGIGVLSIARRGGAIAVRPFVRSALRGVRFGAPQRHGDDERRPGTGEAEVAGPSPDEP